MKYCKKMKCYEIILGRSQYKKKIVLATDEEEALDKANCIMDLYPSYTEVIDIKEKGLIIPKKVLHTGGLK